MEIVGQHNPMEAIDDSHEEDGSQVWVCFNRRSPIVYLGVGVGEQQGEDKQSTCWVLIPSMSIVDLPHPILTIDTKCSPLIVYPLSVNCQPPRLMTQSVDHPSFICPPPTSTINTKTAPAKWSRFPALCPTLYSLMYWCDHLPLHRNRLSSAIVLFISNIFWTDNATHWQHKMVNFILDP